MPDGDIVTLDANSGGEVRLGGIGDRISKRLEKLTGKETRSCTLGHLQRGGAPTSLDRILGMRFGVMAVKLAEEGAFGRMVSYQSYHVDSVPIEEAVHKLRLVEAGQRTCPGRQSRGHLPWGLKKLRVETGRKPAILTPRPAHIPAMSTDPLLELLRRRARFTHQELAELLSLDKDAVARRIAAWEKDGTIRGYHAVIDPEAAGDDSVSAFIEVKVTPERGGGFDRLAMRIARFDQVVSCYLASGGYDLMVVVEGGDLREVARFVSEKLSSMEGVLSTATHFRLKTYKESGFIFERDITPERLAVAP